jgi:predicted short-subunit dehydrogenase-like oxidoreductase (DUF2520 family)
MYYLIGSGRAATHIGHYFGLLGIRHKTWNRRQQSFEELRTGLNSASKVLLLISDSQIEAFAKEHLEDFSGPVVHMSGALEIPGLISAHPLMTFGPHVYGLKAYEKMAFAMSLGVSLSSVFPELENPSFQISAEDKPLYHAWAVYAGNFATLLWQEALPGFQKLGVPPTAVATYLEQVLENALAAPQLALTGPLARKDKTTVKTHLQVLPKPANLIYQSIAQNYAPEVLT